MKARMLLLGIVFLLGADDAKNAAKKEIAKLEGTWVPKSLVYNGKDHPVDGKSAFRLVFKGDIATVEGNDDVKREYAKVVFKLEPGFSPKLADLSVSSGTQKDAKMEGIYELKDDEFKLCVKVLGNDRPTEFSSPEGSSVVFIVFKKDK